jgi:mycothiol synthase
MMSSLITSAKYRIKAVIGRNQKQRPQLEMTWSGLPSPVVPEPSGEFVLRTYRDSDEVDYRDLVENTFGHRFELDYWLERVVDDGFVIVEHEPSGKIAATCMAARYPTERYPDGGNLGWLAARSEFQGNGLGFIVSAAVTKCLVDEGFTNIFLETDDWRLPAIAIYLKLGWTPNPFSVDMASRWSDVERQLSAPRPTSDSDVPS